MSSAVLLLVALTQSAPAQLPTESSRSQAPQEAGDALGRSTPRGTMAAFSRAANRDDFVSAARYVQVVRDLRTTERLARDLKTLLDRYLRQPITTISDSPDGALEDGLPIDRERVGPLIIGQRQADIMLVRVDDPRAGPVWLISRETLAQVPALRLSVPATWIERVMPGPLLRREVFGISPAHWIGLAGSLVIPWILLALLSAGVMLIARRLLVDPARRHDLEAWYAGLRWPAVIVLALAIQLSLMPFLGFPLALRFGYSSFGLILAVVAFAWFMQRLLTLGFSRARSMAWGTARTSTRSLLLLGERVVKVLVVLVAIFAILSIVGVNTKAALAGLGIGGVALALGAQKTVENFLGGAFLLTDRAIAVGDLCRISNRLGWIEDITLRSVRLRTLDQTLVSVPAGVLSQAGIENFATRHKILAQTTLRLRYGTTVTQLRRILDDIGTLLHANPNIEKATASIRLVDFGDRAVELELFAYVLTSDNSEFLAVREGLLLEIAATVEAAGSGFAQPTQFIYVGEEPGGNGGGRGPASPGSVASKAAPPALPTSDAPVNRTANGS